MYLYTILDRHKMELTSRVYYAMKKKSYNGDWIKLIINDLSMINLSLNDEEHILRLNKIQFKKLVSEKIRLHAFIKLEEIKKKHSKVKHISHLNLSIAQAYMQVTTLIILCQVYCLT